MKKSKKKLTEEIRVMLKEHGDLMRRTYAWDGEHDSTANKIIKLVEDNTND